jgi:serine/threonine protein kinase
MVEYMNSRKNNRFREDELLDLFAQICAGVAHLHAQQPPIAHRDIKVENVLLAGGGRLKLCDFGSATRVAKRYETRQEMAQVEGLIERTTTMFYRPPEMVDLFRRQRIGEKVDVWALGCVLYKLAFYVTPFEEGGTLQILNLRYSIPENSLYSANIPKLIAFMLEPDPDRRPDVFEVLERVCSLRGKASLAPRPAWYPRGGLTGDAEKPASAAPAGSSSDSPSLLSATPAGAPAPGQQTAATAQAARPTSASVAPAPAAASNAKIASLPVAPAIPPPSSTSTKPNPNANLFAKLGSNVIFTDPAPSNTSTFSSSSAAPSPPQQASVAARPSPAPAAATQQPQQPHQPSPQHQHQHQHQHHQQHSASSSSGAHEDFGRRHPGQPLSPSGRRKFRVSLRKATCSNPVQGPKPKHVRAIIVDSWERRNGADFFDEVKLRLAKNKVHSTGVVYLKMLVTIHKVIQQGPPEILAAAVEHADVMDSINNVSTQFDSVMDFGNILRAYVLLLRKKLLIHKHYPAFEGNFSLDSWVQGQQQQQQQQQSSTLLPPNLVRPGTLMAFLDLLSTIEELQARIFAQPDPQEMKLAALPALVRESFAIYSVVTKCLCEAAATPGFESTFGSVVSGYNVAHSALRAFFSNVSLNRHLKSLLTIPAMPAAPLPFGTSNGVKPPPSVTKAMFAGQSRGTSIWSTPEQLCVDDVDHNSDSGISDNEGAAGSGSGSGSGHHPHHHHHHHQQQQQQPQQQNLFAQDDLFGGFVSAPSPAMPATASSSSAAPSPVLLSPTLLVPSRPAPPVPPQKPVAADPFGGLDPFAGASEQPAAQTTAAAPRKDLQRLQGDPFAFGQRGSIASPQEAGKSTDNWVAFK